MKAKEKIMSRPAGTAFAKHSPFRDAFNAIFIEMYERGVLKKLLGKTKEQVKLHNNKVQNKLDKMSNN